MAYTQSHHQTSDLTAKEFIQVLQLFWVSDFAIQRCVGLHHPRGSADSNSGVPFDPLAVMVRAVVRLGSVSGQGDCSQTESCYLWQRNQCLYNHVFLWLRAATVLSPTSPTDGSKDNKYVNRNDRLELFASACGRERPVLLNKDLVMFGLFIYSLGSALAEAVQIGYSPWGPHLDCIF